MIRKIRDYFRENYAHVNDQEVSDADILAQMEQAYMKDISFERQMDLLYDWMLANQLCEVTP